MKEIFDGVFREGKKLFTINLNPGKKVYGEKLDGKYREWVSDRSKMCAAILNGLRKNPIKKGSKILYLGASTGTTPSHFSDIIGEKGILYCVEFSERVFRQLAELSRERENIAPIFADARKMDYKWIEEVDIVYVDIADPQETEIAIKNAQHFLKKSGYLFVAIKSQSIDVTKNPKNVFKEESDKIKKSFSVLQIIDLEPYEEKHAMIVAIS